MFFVIDKDRTGSLDLEEFVKFARAKLEGVTEMQWSRFHSAVDKNGCVQYLGVTKSPHDVLRTRSLVFLSKSFVYYSIARN